MLIILMLFLIIASIVFLLIKRNKETLYLFGMCLSLAIMLSGVLVYIAKKGGVSQEIQDFFFFNSAIKTEIQYFLITLDDLGLIISIGRYLFPLFLLLLALDYAMIPWTKKNRWLKILPLIPPITSLIIYYPAVFRFLTDNNPGLQQLIISGTRVWIVLYLLMAVSLFVYLIYSARVQVFKRRYFLILGFVMSLCLLYLLYFNQDPAQVYQFYTNNYVWQNTSFYMSTILTVRAYMTIVLLNSVFAIVGFASLARYTFDIIQSNREEVTLQRKSETLHSGTTMFVHGIKNQLLANRVISKRIKRIYEADPIDIDQLKKYTNLIEKQNENMLRRIDDLYRTVKSNKIYLKVYLIKDIIDLALVSFYDDYPNETIQVNLEKNYQVIADKVHLREAIYNLLINAQEAILAKENFNEGEITLSCYEDRSFTVIEIKDNGIGMTRSEFKKASDPFYTNKNTNYNWGMGLQYVRMIAKEHFGSLRYESKKSVGSTFYLLIAKYMKKSDEL